MAYEKLFEKGRIGGLTIRNRAVMSPMGTDMADTNGNASQRLIAYYAERAKGGIGLIINEYTGVDDVDSIPTQHNLRMAQDYNVKAAEELEKEGVSCRVVSMHTIKPIDKEMIIDSAKNTGGIITVEEHNLMGGLGSAVAEVLCDENIAPKKFKRLAFPDVNVAKIGGQAWIREQYGLQAGGIAQSIRDVLK